MKVLDLFSGIGGFSLGLEKAGMETIGFVEIDPFCQSVLKTHWPDVPVYDDVKTLHAKDFETKPDIICGGFPCQPWSVAGKQRGKKDDRHLWPEMLRVIKEFRPSWVIAENVVGLVNLGLDEVLFDLEGAGYTTQSFVIPAAGVNASHRRERVWVVGYAEHHGSSTSEIGGESAEDARESEKGAQLSFELEGTGRSGDSQDVANAESDGLQMWSESGDFESEGSLTDEQSARRSELLVRAINEAKPSVGRKSNGIPRWLDGLEFLTCPDSDGTPRITEEGKNRAARIKALGNAVVPHIPHVLGKAILEVEKKYAA